MSRYITLTLIAVVALVITACGNNTMETVQESSSEFAIIAEPSLAEPVAAAPVVDETAAEVSAVTTVGDLSEALSNVGSAEAETVVEAADAATYLVDAGASQMIWTGDYALSSGHTGTIDMTEGQLIFAGTTFTGGTITIDMTSMAATSLSGSRADELLEHLMNEDFFEVTTYPTAVLLLHSAEPTSVENQYVVTADLTIKDITHEIVFTTDVTLGDGTLTATSNLEFDRTEWDVVYNSGSFFSSIGDRAIKDEVAVQVTLVASTSE